MEKRKHGRRLTPLEVVAIAVITLLTILNVKEFRESHFLRGTVIGEVDCSYMTVNKALNKVQQEAGEYTISSILLTEQHMR